MAPASVVRAVQRRPVISPTEPSTWIPSSSPFPYQKRLPATRLNIAGNQRTCYVKLLCNGLSWLLYDGNGRGGIRTHGGFPHARFRVECLKPDSATLPKGQKKTPNAQRPTSNVECKPCVNRVRTVDNPVRGDGRLPRCLWQAAWISLGVEILSLLGTPGCLPHRPKMLQF